MHALLVLSSIPSISMAANYKPAGAVLSILMMMMMMMMMMGSSWYRIGLCNATPVQFVFGDSLSDVGNNNYLPRGLARAALPWYGIDLGTGMPNGRFTNGRTVADIIGDYMGYPRPKPFLDPSLDEDAILANGVSYASGGGGILNDTGQLFIQRFCFYKQIELFQGTQVLIRDKIGEDEAEKFFSEASYVIALGSNDYINNFLLPVYPDSWKYSSTGFTNLLISTLRDQLTLLHSMGARNMIFFGLGPMGCIPLQRVLTSNYICQESTNKLAVNFNDGTRDLMAELSATLPNATFQFGDAYKEFAEMISNPVKYGFNNSDMPCCKIWRIRPSLTCTPASSLCKDRSQYVFWDEYHPTDAANNEIAKVIIKKLGFKPLNATTSTPSSNSSSPVPTPAPKAAGAPMGSNHSNLAPPPANSTARGSTTRSRRARAPSPSSSS